MALAGVFAGACATAVGNMPSDDAARTLRDGPVLLAGAVAADRSGACQTPVRDPSSGVVLTLVRSSLGRGDYRPAPVDAYGLRVTELVRVECRNGRVVGAVSA